MSTPIYLHLTAGTSIKEGRNMAYLHGVDVADHYESRNGNVLECQMKDYPKIVLWWMSGSGLQRTSGAAPIKTRSSRGSR